MKKHIIYCLLMVLAILEFTSCTDILNEKVYTKPSLDYLLTTPSGMANCVIAMYDKDRSFYNQNSSTEWMNMMVGHDIVVGRAGGGIPTNGRYITLTSGNGLARVLWEYNYKVIGYANLVAETSKKVDMTDPVAIKALSEAKVFRAHSYYLLLSKYDRLFLTTRVTTPENVNDTIKYTPAVPDSVFKLINSDLDYAIKNLSWTTKEPGRFTQGAARHIKALVAAYQKNWPEVAKQVNAIEKSGTYQLMPIDQIFNGPNLNHSEAIWTIQFSNKTGGANGHQFASHFIPTYNQEKGMTLSMDQGGYPWGRLFPNTYLLSLYNKSTDRRYKVFYKHAWTYNDPTTLPRGKKLGDTIVATNSAQFLNVHPACMKYNDPTAPSPNGARSYKDIIRYRLAHSYLLGAEAYFHLGNADSTAYYYNKTWVRAGNTAIPAGGVTLNMIIDENARELAFEADRWVFLKRNGILLERTKKYGGEYIKNAQGVVLIKDTVVRDNIQPMHVRLPIPKSQIEIMGAANFPQNEGYN